ncbi:MAG: HAMP domain-containing histidine kinase [Actinomycetota bacterium]|nr:HAMP domain-containing histidine kinase [Actinomycetota bacterium]
MIRLPESLTGVLHRQRPVLRVQLALLYSGVFVGLVVVLFLASSVLFGTANVFFGHSQTAFHPGAAAAARRSAAGPQFTPWPLLLALAAIAIGVLAAWWLAGRFLRPLRAMTTAAREISATNLDRRLSLEGPDDELTELGRTLDDLFGRLQASFESQRQFVANASHELRTPLAGQRTLLQVALADPDADAPGLRSTCEEALELSGHQERLIEALLTLATSERGIESWEPFDLAQLTQDIVHSRRPDAERHGVQIDATLDEAHAVGDPGLVASLVANLLDNAIRHNVADGAVKVSTSATPDGARLTVSNTGAVVPFIEVERLFQPFQRLGDQRVGPADGHGLGLTIVKAIATAHRANLTARPRPKGGLDIQITFRPNA